MKIEPVTLEGRHVRLEPLSWAHFDELVEAGADESIWRWMTGRGDTPEGMRAFIDLALRWQEEGTALPFATIDPASGRAIGSTRFGNIDTANRRVEIGWTWITPAFQRTAANSEAKYLMLRHAFETWGVIRVELKTDALNEKSRRAILRIGAREEGTFRQHMIMPDGRLRDTVYYSIIDREWPEVRAFLEKVLGVRS